MKNKKQKPGKKLHQKFKNHPESELSTDNGEKEIYDVLGTVASRDLTKRNSKESSENTTGDKPDSPDDWSVSWP